MDALLGKLAVAIGKFAVAGAGMVNDLEAIPKEQRQIVPPSAMRSLDDTIARVVLITGNLQGLAAESPAKFLAVPSNRVTSLQAQINEAFGHIKSIRDQWAQVVANGGFAGLDGNAYVQTTNGQAIDIPSYARSLEGNLDNMFDQYYQIASVIRPRKFGEFNSSLKAVLDNKAESSRLVDEIRNLREELGSLKEETFHELNAARSAAGEAQVQADKAIASQTTTEGLESEITERHARVNEILDAADSLETSVNEYSAQFSKFQQQLDAREKVIKDGREQVEALRKELDERREEILGIEDRAKAMLEGATVAGLSCVYKAELTTLDGKLRATQRSYYYSIFALFLLMVLAVMGPQNMTAFVAAHVLGQPVAIQGQDKKEAVKVSLEASKQGLQANAETEPAKENSETAGVAAIHSFASIATRFAIILPGLLLAGFASRRHSALFRLREQYAYKYSIAASVEGFKNQAPTLKEEIAASVFHELLFNPADRMDRHQPVRRNGVLERLISPVVARVHKFGKPEEGKDDKSGN